MLLDSLLGMNALHDKLETFLRSRDDVIDILADTNGSPEPYETLLYGLRVIKSDGPILLRLDDQKMLVFSGSSENLLLYISYFRFENDEEGNHHHPKYVWDVERRQPKQGYLSANTLSLIIEVDSEWLEHWGKR